MQIPILLKNKAIQITLVLICALIVRLSVIYDFYHSYYWDFIFWDESPYHNLAIKINSGEYRPNDIYTLSPYLLYLHCFIYDLLGTNINFIRFVNLFLGTASCFLIYFLGARIFTRETGFLAGLIAAFYQPLVLYSSVPIKTAFNIFFFLLFILFILMAFEKKRYLFMAGVCLALIIPGRQQCLLYLYLIPMISIVYRNNETIRRCYLSCSFLFLLGAGVVLFPVALRNYAIGDNFRVTPNTSGFSLYSVYDPANPTPYFRIAPFAAAAPPVLQYKTSVEARRRTGLPLTSSEASDYWLKEAWHELPRMGFQKFFSKILAVINKFEEGDNYDLNFLPEVLPSLKFSFIYPAFVLPAAMAGLLFSGCINKKSRLLFIVILLYGAGLAASVCESRFRLLMIAALIPFVAQGLIILRHTILELRLKKSAYFITTFLAFYFLASLPLPGTDDSSTGLNTHALLLQKHGKLNEAITYLKRTEESKDSYSDIAKIALGNIYLNKDIRKAKNYFGAIPNSSIIAASKFEALAKVEKKQKNITKYIQYLENALDYDSSRFHLSKTLANYYKDKDPVRSSHHAEQAEKNKKFFDLIIKNG